MVRTFLIMPGALDRAQPRPMMPRYASGGNADEPHHDSLTRRRTAARVLLGKLGARAVAVRRLRR